MKQNLALCNSPIAQNPPIKQLACQVPLCADRGILCNRCLIKTFPEAYKTLAELVAEDERTMEEHKELRKKITNDLFLKGIAHDKIEIATELVFTIARRDYVILHDVIAWENMVGEKGVSVPCKNRSGFYRIIDIGDRLQKNRSLLAQYRMSKKGKSSEKEQFDLKIQRARIFPIGNLVQLNKMGKAKCPLHSEKTPSFSVNIKKNLWFCFGCNKGGDVISLAMEMYNCDFITAVKKLS